MQEDDKKLVFTSFNENEARNNEVLYNYLYELMNGRCDGMKGKFL